MDKEKNVLSLEDLWEESGGEINSGTFQEFVRLGKRVDKEQRRRRIKRIVFTAVAAVAALVAVALLSFSLTRHNYELSPLDATRSLVARNGDVSSITLPDGSTVCLNGGSTLLYPESFDADKRIVYLSGEGNFSVAKDPERPFIVKTAYMDIQALGTTFSVHSYVDERTIRATLKEGKVRVDIPSAEQTSYILEPDMQLVFTPAESSVKLQTVDAARVLAWENGLLSFSDASFPEVASALERRFNVSISYNAVNMRDNALNVRFLPDETLEDALDILTLLIPGSRYKKDENRIYYQF